VGGSKKQTAQLSNCLWREIDSLTREIEHMKTIPTRRAEHPIGAMLTSRALLLMAAAACFPKDCCQRRCNPVLNTIFRFRRSL
jgi:hypothetical protein